MVEKIAHLFFPAVSSESARVAVLGPRTVIQRASLAHVVNVGTTPRRIWRAQYAWRPFLVAHVLLRYASLARAQRSPRPNQVCWRRFASAWDPAGSWRLTLEKDSSVAPALRTKNRLPEDRSRRSDQRFVLPAWVEWRSGSAPRGGFSCVGHDTLRPHRNCRRGKPL